MRINTAGELADLRARIAALSVDSGDLLWMGVRPSDMAWIASDNYGPDDLQQSCREVFQQDYDGYAYMCRDGERADFTDGESDPVATITKVDIKDHPEVVDFCYKHGLLRKARCRNYQRNGERAQRKARELYSGTWKLSDQTVSNAFQHAYWTAEDVNTAYPSYINEALQLAYLWEHDQRGNRKYESSDAGIRRPSQMDILNDQTGYYVALDEIAAKGVRSEPELCRKFASDGLPQQYPKQVDPFDDWYDRGFDYSDNILFYRRSYDKNGTLVKRINLNC